MFSQSQPAFPILAAGAYLVSLLWILVAQVGLLKRLLPDRGLGARVGLVLAGELLALFPGALVIAALMAGVQSALNASGLDRGTVDGIVVSDVHRPWLAGPMLLLWLAAWGLVASATKALLLRGAWKLTQIPWGLALRMSARAYAGTAVATVAIVVALLLG